MSDNPFIRVWYHRPPGRLDVYDQRLVHEEDEASVTLLERARLERPLYVRGECVLEPDAPVLWFTFRHVMHDVGRFHLRDGTFTGFYADVIRPVVFHDRWNWHITDLFLDVWLGTGNLFEVLDAEELEAAAARGSIDAETKRVAWAEMERLRTAWHKGSWPPAVVHEWTLERARRQLEVI